MYLIPPDESELEHWAKPERLIANQQTMSIGVTTSWEHINQLAADKKIFSVIIHHAAIGQVNPEELSYLFRRKWFVVTGLGIPSDEMYKLIGMSNLFINKPDYCPTASNCYFTTQAYYLALAYRIEGSPEDIKIIEASTDVRGDISVDGKVGVIIKRATDSLLGGDETIADMLLEIEIQIQSINRKDIYGTE